jgi:hypothetical protein
MLSHRVSAFVKLLSDRTSVVAPAIQQDDRHVQRLYFALWRQHVRTERTVSSLTAKIPLQAEVQARSALLQWRTAADRARERKARLEHVLTELQKRRMREALSAWRADAMQAKIASEQEVKLSILPQCVHSARFC